MRLRWSNSEGWNGPRSAASCAICGARKELTQSMPWGLSTCSMRAEVSMPRSPTQAICSMPKRSFSLATWAATVAGSAVLPLNTSTAIGQPSAVQIRPNTICGSSRLPSRECPRAASSQQRPVSQVEVRSYSTSVEPTRCWRARRRSMAGCASCSQSSERYRSSTLHWPTLRVRPSDELAVSSCSARCVASLEAGSSTRATSMACSSGCSSCGAEPNHSEEPEPRAAPSTAATCPCGSARSMLSTDAADSTATPPLSSTRKCSTSWGSQCDRLASVRLTTLPFSR